MTGFTGYVRRYEFNKKLRTWETCTILAEKEFKKLQDQADFNKHVDPLIYVGKLILSVFAFLIALSFIVVIFLSFLAGFGIGTDGVNPLEQIGAQLHDDTTTTLDLVLTIVYS